MFFDGESRSDTSSYNTPDFPNQEYSFVDVAEGSVKNRNNIKDIRELNFTSGPVENYTTYFRYTDDLKKHVDKSGSVSGAGASACYCDHIWFDIDSTDLNIAHARSKNLLGKIQTLDPSLTDSTAIYFSGAKGFHIGIPSTHFALMPSAELPEAVRAIALTIAGDVQIDTSIYQGSRLWRVPNSYNRKGGCYKVQLAWEQALEWDIPTITEYSKEPKGAVLPLTYDRNKYPILPTCVDLRIIAVTSDKRHNRQRTRTTQRTGGPVEIQKLKPCEQGLWQCGAQEGTRNEVGIRLACGFRRTGHNRQETTGLLTSWNARNTPPLRQQEVDAILASAFDSAKTYEYGCNDSILQGQCRESCVVKKKTLKGRRPKENKAIEKSFVDLGDGSVAEIVYVRNEGVKFALYRPTANVGNEGHVGNVGEVTLVNEVEKDGQVIVPTDCSQMVEGNCMLLPSGVAEYGSDAELIERISAFIYHYLCIPDAYLMLASHYVLFTYIYDKFEELPYLRAIGDFGSGKSRFLLTIGSLCYRPVFGSGCSSSAAIYRVINKYRGTLIVDEADFSDSDESHQIVKILNSGYQSRIGMLKCEKTSATAIDPTAFNLYGPKLVGSKRVFKDPALESRCLTQRMDGTLNRDVPFNLDANFERRAIEIRNMLTLWRLRNYSTPVVLTEMKTKLHPRLRQIGMPLLSIMRDSEAISSLLTVLETINTELTGQHKDSREGRVFAAIIRLLSYHYEKTLIPISAITVEYNGPLEENRRPTSPVTVGKVLWNDLGFVRSRVSEGSVLDLSDPRNVEKMAFLKKKYEVFISKEVESSDETAWGEFPAFPPRSIGELSTDLHDLHYLHD